MNFGTGNLNDPVRISSSGPSTAGSAFSLTCSAILVDPLHLPSNVPPPSFEWFYGPHGNASLPSGVIPSATVRMDHNDYTSTLQFSPALYESHAGMYTCRLGAGRLRNSTVVSVNGIIIIMLTHIGYYGDEKSEHNNNKNVAIIIILLLWLL